MNNNNEAAILDDHAVDIFAKAMKDKLGIKRQQGFGGWHDIRQTSSMRLADLLLAAVAKGDPVDVANFAMMLFCRHENHEALKGSCAKFCGGRLSVAPLQPTPSAETVRDVLNEALQTAAGTLPDGYDIIVTVERDAGRVELLGPDGDKLDFPSNRENLASSVSDALEHAIAVQTGEKL